MQGLGQVLYLSTEIQHRGYQAICTLADLINAGGEHVTGGTHYPVDLVYGNFTGTTFLVSPSPAWIC